MTMTDSQNTAPDTPVIGRRLEVAPQVITIASPGNLDVRLTFSLIAGAVATAILVVLLQPYRETLWGKVILERGATQFLSLFLTLCVLAFVAGKILRMLSAERGKQVVTSVQDVSQLSFVELLSVRDSLCEAGDTLSLLRARALQAFLISRKRSAAAEQLQEDISLAQGHVEQGYAIPRVMIWAIPLMGFIGTVVGISSAVAGFTGFLQGAEEIDQVRAAIGNVTTGLAIAFDTTLVALVLSVVAMLALSVTERMEIRRLLSVESTVNDTIVNCLPERGDLDSRTLREHIAPLLDAHAVALQTTVRDTIQKALPEPEQIVRPAQAFLREAAGEIAASARASAGEIGTAVRELHRACTAVIDGMHAEHDRHAEISARRDRENAEALRETTIAVQTATAQALRQLQEISERQAVALDTTTTVIAARLDRLSSALEERLAELNELSKKVSEANALERSLDRTLRSLAESGELQSVLGGVRASLDGLQPMMERLAQPRRILLVEAENAQAQS